MIKKNKRRNHDKNNQTNKHKKQKNIIKTRLERATKKRKNNRRLPNKSCLADNQLHSIKTTKTTNNNVTHGTTKRKR